jgi:3-hydroxyacyl-CoA dehydrogenase/enoyl-CoA hydratase/3-hydroxybutyryl-CoA epimerase
MSSTFQHLDFSITDHVAWLGLDMADKSVNVFNHQTMEEFSRAIRLVYSQNDLLGLIIYSKKKHQYIAGASIDEIASITDPSVGADKARQGQDIMQSIENLKIPVVAAINGPCVGGGLEMALACSYRIVTDSPKVRLQLPEVQLGILPGFGGTQRLPQWLGLTPSLDMILAAKPLDGKRALRLGLVDDIVPEPLLLDVAQQWLAKGKRKPFPYKQKFWQRKLEALKPVQKIILNQAGKAVMAKTKGQYPAPLQALEVIEKTFGQDDPFSYDLEAQKLGSLVASPICKSLVGLFQWTEAIKKTKPSLPPQPIYKTAVLGAGVMGAGIAHLFAKKGFDVRVKDISIDALENGMRHIHQLFAKEQRKKRLPNRWTDNHMHRVSFTTQDEGFQRCQLVVEAIVEDMAVKKKVLGELTQHVSQDTIIATNTSALSISEMAKAIDHPERVVGFHFFNPVHRMPLIEIIQGQQTSEQTLSTAFAFALQIGKTPILVADSPGFLVNRILGLYLGEAMRMAEEGFSIGTIDAAMEKFGMPMGPFKLIDEVGIDVAQHVGKFLSSHFDYFPSPSNLLSRMIEKKRLGKKNGLGFYVHQNNKAHLDRKWIKNLGLESKAETEDETLYKEIADRLVLLMANEAFRCLEEKVVRQERDVDVGMVLGTGFAPFRGGLLKYARSRDLQNVQSLLKALAQKHGSHFAPCSYLVEQSYRAR